MIEANGNNYTGFVL